MGGSIRIYSRANYEDIDCESKWYSRIKCIMRLQNRE